MRARRLASCKHPKLFLGQAGAAFAGDLGEHFIELGVELLFRDDRRRSRLARAPHGRRRRATDSAFASAFAPGEPARKFAALA